MTKVVTELEEHYGAVECRALEFEAKGNSVFFSMLDGDLRIRTMELDRNQLKTAMLEELGDLVV